MVYCLMKESLTGFRSGSMPPLMVPMVQYHSSDVATTRASFVFGRLLYKCRYTLDKLLYLASRSITTVSFCISQSRLGQFLRQPYKLERRELVIRMQPVQRWLHPPLLP